MHARLQAYVMVATALLMVYSVIPFSAAGVSARAYLVLSLTPHTPIKAIVRLKPCGEDNRFFTLLETFQTKIGAHITEVVKN